MEINEAIRQKRLEKNISRQALSEVVGIETHYLYMIETGRRNPSTKLRKKLFNALGIEVIYK